MPTSVSPPSISSTTKALAVVCCWLADAGAVVVPADAVDAVAPAHAVVAADAVVAGAAEVADAVSDAADVELALV